MSLHLPAPAYILASLRETSNSWYVEYYYQGPNGTLVRVRNNVNRLVKHIKRVADRRAFVQKEIITPINIKLAQGWTPLFDKAQAVSKLSVTPWEEVRVSYLAWIETSDLRHITMLNYRSNMKKWQEFLDTFHGAKVKYIYELNVDICRTYLEWIMSVKHQSKTTRDNCRAWLCLFCAWCVDCGYLKENPCLNIKTLGGGHRQKKKEPKAKQSTKYIDKRVRARIFKWMRENDRPLLLACLLCHCCLLRPHEIAQLKVEHIHLKKSLIFVPGSISKNKTDAWVTLPDEVARLMLDLHVLEHPGDWYLFDHHLEPSGREKPCRGDEIRERWRMMRDALGLPKTLWMYHLKHTGITDMVEVMPPRQVQKQARHHSLEMTEIYMQAPEPEAVAAIKEMKI